MTSDLILGLLILIGFWTAVFWAAVRWAKKRNRPVGRTIWQVILWAMVLSGAVRLLQVLLGFKT